MGDRRGRDISELGGFDLLINNAGIEITSLIFDLDPKDVRLMLDVNVLGPDWGSSTRSVWRPRWA